MRNLGRRLEMLEAASDARGSGFNLDRLTTSDLDRLEAIVERIEGGLPFGSLDADRQLVASIQPEATPCA